MNLPFDANMLVQRITGRDRPVILTFVRHYLPGYKSGGPVRSIANIVEALGDDFDFRIITSDHDATEDVPYFDILAGEWTKVGKARVLYLPPEKKKRPRIAEILRTTPHDILYLNSFFDPDFTVLPLLARRLRLAPKTRCIIAPRGEFAKGALRIKAIRKHAFLMAAVATGLYRNLEWHASSKYERADIRRAQHRTANHVKVAIDLSDMSSHKLPPCTARRAGDPLRICFVARIAPVKNLHYALDVLRNVGVPVRFDIYGPIRDTAYWSYCETRIRQLPANIKAKYRGALEHEQVSPVMSGYDLFFMPTQGENYGHSILEALSSGTPVLIADTTPWRMLARQGVGWDLPLDQPDAFAVCVRALAGWDWTDIAAMKSRAAAFASRRKLNRKAVEENRQLFL